MKQPRKIFIMALLVVCSNTFSNDYSVPIDKIAKKSKTFIESDEGQAFFAGFATQFFMQHIVIPNCGNPGRHPRAQAILTGIILLHGWNIFKRKEGWFSRLISTSLGAIAYDILCVRKSL
jgi:hypothetical protein